MKCAICLETRPPTSRRCAIKCGHVFCEQCIQQFCASRHNHRQPIICPTCRAPFSGKPPDLITLFIEYEEEDEIEVETKLLTHKEKEDAALVSADAERLGLESEATELEAVVAKAESLILRVRVADDADMKEILLSIQDHLKALRERLVYAHRLSSLKEENTKLISARDKYQAALDTVLAKYENGKEQRRDALRKYAEAKERLKAMLERERVWVADLRERDAMISELQKSFQTENERVLKQVVAANVARDAALGLLESAQKEVEQDKRKLLKWEKKYHAAKQKIAAHTTSRYPRENDADDSLEIIPPPRGGQRGKAQLSHLTRTASAIEERDVEASVYVISDDAGDDDDAMDIDEDIREIPAMPTRPIPAPRALRIR